MSEGNPRNSEHHDVLVISRDGDLYRVPVEKSGADAGAYRRPPEPAPLDAPGARKVLTAADPYPPVAGEPQRGPALATLPVNADPSASSFFTCYLLNTKNLNYRTPWTNEEWNDPPGGVNYPPVPTPRTFELVVAAPDGTTYLIRRGEDDDAPFTFQELDLGKEGEVWSQLRNGCVAGNARVEAAGNRVVPLVNVASLTPSR